MLLTVEDPVQEVSPKESLVLSLPATTGQQVDGLNANFMEQTVDSASANVT